MKHRFNPRQSNVIFEEKEQRLHIIIESKQLIISSLELSDKQNCFDIFGDPLVMEKYADGLPYTEEKKQDRFNMWTNRWQNHDPFSAYKVIEKKSGEFIGIIGIGQESRGESELFYALKTSHWGKGYGKEMVQSMLHSLVPQLMIRGYKCMSAHLKMIEADVDQKNEASLKILRRIGFQQTGFKQRFGSERAFFQISAKQLKNQYLGFFNRLNQQQYQAKRLQHLNDEAEITMAEMAASPFGQRLNQSSK